MPRQVVAKTLEVFEILRQCSPKELAAFAIPELGKLMKHWPELDDASKGEQAGHLLGKHGTDILSLLFVNKGSKCFSALQDLKKAEKLAALETLADPAKKAAITGAAEGWAAKRAEWISNLKIEKDKQGKHVNYPSLKGGA